ncbi:MAG: hypothetical protein KAU38_02765 [Desulfobacterales bacterium]|nr:hypothetical protein [Desulfobacterales bacterium]
MTVCFKSEKKFKELMKELADKERRTVSSFIINAIATYIKDHHKIDWHRARNKPKK